MHIGLIGLGTMGANLARNAARNGATVAVFNRTKEKTDSFIKAYGAEGHFIPCTTIEELLKNLPLPRSIIIMVKAGKPVDDVISELLSASRYPLSAHDTIIDAGNSNDSDTSKRCGTLMKNHGIRFIGLGVSGGEEGALRGPSMMPGGSKEAYDTLQPLLRAMAADDGESGKCVTYLGPEGAGHFVKMVHNGIEYGIMQLLAESYDLLRREAELTNEQMAGVFDEWNQSDTFSSFLVEITAKILRKKDTETGKFLVDLIKDNAGQKGTGKWTTNSALEYGVAVPTITAAVDARIMSSGIVFRLKQSEQQPLAIHPKQKIPDLIPSIKTALELSVLNAYAQGFQLLEAYGPTHEYPLNLSEIARIWRGGCIIRSVLLKQFQIMFTGNRDAAQSLRQKFSKEAQLQWRSVVALGAQRGIPLPAMSASLSYYDSYRTARLPQNLTQAQRDFFGAHGFERNDMTGVFHGNWNKEEADSE